ncbi:MAG TPA: nitroreductase family protein [Clostridiaceae bacterium]|nr:nitroreductase family protein [Clostridiaceae bacterium]
MEANLDLLFTRRSIRKYTDQKIPDELIKIILAAGMAAPSAGNEEPWEFIVVDEREKMIAITEVHPYSAMLRNASHCIITCANPAKFKYPEEYWIQDCSAATQNMLLAANGLGLGAVWLATFPKMDRVEGVRRIFAIPPEIIPVSMISLGYPAEKKAPKKGCNEALIHWNKY